MDIGEEYCIEYRSAFTHQQTQKKTARKINHSTDPGENPQEATPCSKQWGQGTRSAFVSKPLQGGIKCILPAKRKK